MIFKPDSVQMAPGPYKADIYLNAKPDRTLESAVSATSQMMTPAAEMSTPSTAATRVPPAPVSFTPGNLVGVNLSVNGNVEAGAGAPDDSTVVAPPGWTATCEFTAVTNIMCPATVNKLCRWMVEHHSRSVYQL